MTVARIRYARVIHRRQRFSPRRGRSWSAGKRSFLRCSFFPRLSHSIFFSPPTRKTRCTTTAEKLSYVPGGMTKKKKNKLLRSRVGRKSNRHRLHVIIFKGVLYIRLNLTDHLGLLMPKPIPFHSTLLCTRTPRFSRFPIRSRTFLTTHIHSHRRCFGLFLFQ